MKKLSALLLALVLTAAPLPKAAAHTQELLVRYSAEQGFTVTIPEAVTLYSGTEEATGYGTFGVNSGSLLSAGQKLAIAITASQNYYAGKFRLKCSGESVYIPYSISAGQTAVERDKPFLEATAEEVNNGKSVVLTYRAGLPKLAGDYSDVLTITVTVVAL